MRLKLRTAMQRWLPVRSTLADDRGVTSLEYGLIAAVMVIAIASTIRSMSDPVHQAFLRVYNAIF